MNIIYKTSPIGELKDIDEKSGIVKGYGSIFGNIDSDGDIISKGAYTKTIKENGDRVYFLPITKCQFMQWHESSRIQTSTAK